jgi:hypothetical protein
MASALFLQGYQGDVASAVVGRQSNQLLVTGTAWNDDALQPNPLRWVQKTAFQIVPMNLPPLSRQAVITGMDYSYSYPHASGFALTLAQRRLVINGQEVEQLDWPDGLILFNVSFVLGALLSNCFATALIQSAPSVDQVIDILDLGSFPFSQ